MPFEVYQPLPSGVRSRVPYPAVTLGKNGVFTLNGLAFRELGEPDRVVLLFDQEAQAVGLRVPGPDEDGISYRTNRVGKGNSMQVPARAFARYSGVWPDETRRWRARMVDGVLEVDLTAESTVVTSNRAK